MRYKTELMKEILKNEKAQEMIDYISSWIYGDSYVGLWIFEAMGTALFDACEIAKQLRYETSAWTTELTMDYWERHYGLPVNKTMDMEQRRKILIAKIQERGPCNPTRLAAAVSAALGGVPVEITENVAKNTFLVNIREVVDSINPAVAVLERRKPAHLIYWIQVVTQTVSEADIKIAVAATRSEKFNVEVLQ